MSHAPLLEETIAGPDVEILAEIAAMDPGGAKPPSAFESELGATSARRLTVYPPAAVFDLDEELGYLSRRAIEPNIFFNPNFMAPAIPRLEDKDVRVAVLRDETTRTDGLMRSRLRLALPFAIEKPAFGVGPSIMRVWSNDFGPLGTPLIDGDDPFTVVDEFLTIIARPHLRLPRVLVLPDLYTEGMAAGLFRAAALGQGFGIHTVGAKQRVVLDSEQDGDSYLAGSLSANHRRNHRRLWRNLAKTGDLQFNVTRQRDALFDRVEQFLALEGRGWKGRNRTALIADKLQAAFAREALDRLAASDQLRVYTLDLDGKAIASLLVLIEAGVAYAWKIAFDERYAAYSPGRLLLIEATRQNLRDPNIVWSDGCAEDDIKTINWIWRERREIATLVIGLGPDADLAARRVSHQLELYSQTRMAAKSVRDQVRASLKALWPGKTR